MEKYIRKFYENISPERPWIKCESAFGCMVLYKTKSILNKIYNGSVGCEHVRFNSGLKMFINPRFFSG
jgi:hypothetical protein